MRIRMFEKKKYKNQEKISENTEKLKKKTVEQIMCKYGMEYIIPVILDIKNVIPATSGKKKLQI